jgi:hypothetical protein
MGDPGFGPRRRLRYRRLKKRILDTRRVATIEAILQRLDGEGMPAEATPHAKRTADKWRDDPDVGIDIGVIKSASVQTQLQSLCSPCLIN